MYLAVWLGQVREAKNLPRGDIEKRTGLLRRYISRVENGYTVPALETLEKIARALETPLYQLFYTDEETPPDAPEQCHDLLGLSNSLKSFALRSDRTGIHFS